MDARGKVDYYAVLGVPPTATAREIKAAYRARAKELHPDRNRSPDAAREFQRLHEAFVVLGNSRRRILYAQDEFAAAEESAARPTETRVPPVPCEDCGCIPAEPRFVHCERVISVVVASYRLGSSGVFCPACASKRLFWGTFVTGAMGWLGWRGFVWSCRGVAENLRGGMKPPAMNAFVLGRQAAWLMRQGRTDLAEALARESLSYFRQCPADGADYSEVRTWTDMARTIVGAAPGRAAPGHSPWSGWSIPARFAFAGLTLAAVCWAALVVSAAGLLWPHEPVSTIGSEIGSMDSSLAPGQSVPFLFASSSGILTAALTPFPDSFVEVAGPEGHTYRVSRDDFQRLETMIADVKARVPALETRYNDIRLRSAKLEIDRLTIDRRSRDAINEFNRTLEALNADRVQFAKDRAEIDELVAAFNAELLRVGEKVR